MRTLSDNPIISSKIGAIAWLLTTQFFICAAIAGSLAVPHYDGIRQVLSDLGVTNCVALKSFPYFCSPAHGLFAVSLFVQGSCMIIGAVCLRAIIRDLVALLCCIAAGLSLYGVGAFPENGGFTAHVVFAAVHCFAANAWIARMAFLAHRSRERYIYPAIFYGTACVIGSFSSIALLFEHAISPVIGTVERFAMYPFPVLLILYAIAVLRGGTPLSLSGGNTQSFHAGVDATLNSRKGDVCN